MCTAEAPTRGQATRIAGRYLPSNEVESYVDAALRDNSLLIRMRPERWLSNDHSKA